MKRARIDRLGDLSQGKVLSLPFFDVFLSSLNHQRLCILLVRQNLVADQRNMLGEDSQQP